VDVYTETAARSWNLCPFTIERSACVATKEACRRALMSLRALRPDAMVDFPWRPLYLLD
jgi:hypothetical protein